MSKENEIGLVYAGQRLGHNKKMYHKYIEVSNMGNFFTFNKKVARIEIIGNLISCVSKGGSSYGDFKIVGKIEEGDKRFEDINIWFLKQRAAMEEVRQIKINKQQRSESLESKVKNIQNDIKYLNRKQKNDVALWIYTQLLK